MMIPTCLPLLLALPFVGANAPESPTSLAPEVVAKIDALVADAMTRKGIPGASIAVVKAGTLAMAKGYGRADVEQNVPAAPETVYQLASITKTFTAAAVMLLEKDGELALDDRLVDHLHDLPDAWKEVTIQQLLNHTSGIKSYTSVDGFDRTLRKDFTPPEILALVADAPLEFPPGERWEYSNTGYFLLGLLIQEVAGKSYGEVLADRIFHPLEMKQTRVNDLRALIPGRARGYARDGEALVNGEYVSPSQPFSAGALASSVLDLAKWDAALTAGAPIDSSILDRMWRPAQLADGGRADYGLGWAIHETNGRRTVSHGGGIPGFSTQITRFLDDHLSVIVLTNLEGDHAERLAREIAAAVVPELAEPPVAPIADSDPETTARLRSLLDGAAEGDVDPSLFTEDAGPILIPRIRAARDDLAALGVLKNFELLRRKDADDGPRLEYRATFPYRTLRASFTLDGAGKIRGLIIRPQE